MRPVFFKRLFGIFRIGSLAFVFVIIGGEMLARYIGAPQPYSALYVYDEILGYRSPANKQVTFSAGESTYSVYFDGEGIADRAGEHGAEIVILGDGVTAGLEVQPQDRLAHQLSRLLGGKGVVNLSITGYGTIQQALLLEDWLARQQIRPKQVILVFNLANDVIDNVREWDGAGAPNVSLAKRDGVVLPPTLPSVFHRKAAALYHESRLAGYLSNLNNHPSDERIPSQLTDLFAPQLSDEMKSALLGTRAGFAKLEKLSHKYAFELRGVFWVDRGLLGDVGSESIANAVNHIQHLTTGVKWTAADDLSEKVMKGKAWNDSAFVAGTRHANALEMERIAQQMKATLMLKKND